MESPTAVETHVLARATVETHSLVQSPSLTSVGDPIFGTNAVTRDLATGLDWLDLTLSTNRSYDDITGVDGSNELVAGGDFAGWRYATVAEIRLFFLDAGIPDVPGFSPANHDPVVALMTLVGITCVDQCGDLPTSIGVSGTPDAANPPLLFLPNLQEWASLGFGRTDLTLLSNPSTSAPYLGHWLVRPAIVEDNTAPVIVPSVDGTLGANGWYTSNVTVSFTVNDPESTPALTGCDNTTVSSNTSSMTFTCSSTSAGGTASKSVTIKRDATIPAVTGTPSGALGANGWYTSDVGITWTPSATGPSGQTPSSGCTTVALTGDTPSYTFTCAITTGAGITSAPGMVTVKRDATKPVVTYAGNAESYTVDQPVAITCTPSDNLSGVASSTCAAITGGAYSFPSGANTYSATATDKAGNGGSATTAFTVNVTSGSVCSLVQRWVSNGGVANSMCVKLNQASYGAFRNELAAQSGKKLSEANAAILVRLVNVLDPQ
jgi:hypothetical protein